MPAAVAPGPSPLAALPEAGGGYDYANYFEAGFSREEILLRFAQAYDGLQDRTDRARIVMTPHYARALLMLLQSTLTRFEAMQALADPASASASASASGTGDAGQEARG